MRSSLVPILFGVPRAVRQVGAAAAGMAINFIDGSMFVRDPTTPANNFSGKYTSKLTITGSLPWGGQGPTLDASNFATLATSKFPYDANTGTLIAEYSITTLTNGQRIADIAADMSTRVIDLFTNATQAVIFGSGGVGSAAFGPTIVAGTVHKSAIAYALNDYAWSGDGGTVGTDTSTTVPAPTTLYLGQAADASGPMLGRLRSITYFPRRFTNAELQAATA